MRTSRLRHSVLCYDSGARHCFATKLCTRDKDALSRQCGTVLHRDKEGHVRVTNQAERARQGWCTKDRSARQRYYVMMEISLS